MALLQCEYKSETLGVAVNLNVILSQQALLGGSSTKKSPVLYLLHGLSDNHSAWLRRTSIERYAEAYDLAVVMPAVNRSFYTNMYSGPRYWDFVADELPSVCQTFFPIATGRENTFAAGNSMGGYGAFKLALSRPDRYAAAASLSGALDLLALHGERHERLPEWQAIFGPAEGFAGSDNDLLHLAAAAAESDGPLPALFQCCGREDYLYPVNESFHARCQAAGIPITYEQEEGGHDWGYWDFKIQRVLEWLPLRSATWAATQDVENAAADPSNSATCSSLPPSVA